MARPRSALSMGIMLLLAALVLGCDDDDGNCTRSDCRTDADCPGNWVCSVAVLIKVCVEPGATSCDLGTFDLSASVFDDGEIVGPVTPLEGPETSSPTPPAWKASPSLLRRPRHENEIRSGL